LLELELELEEREELELELELEEREELELELELEEREELELLAAGSPPIQISPAGEILSKTSNVVCSRYTSSATSRMNACTSVRDRNTTST
jgi:hypothetical protein